MCFNVLPPYMSVHHVHACGVHKKASDPLAMELQMILSHDMNSGTKPGPLQEQQLL